ncbi:MAG TPA: hypothetical protein VII49_11395 [Rhizomicrobium sp.]
MGSLLEAYLRQRDLRNFLRTQKLTIASQLSAVDNQIRQILDSDRCRQQSLGRSVYLHRYIIGILDAITSFYERETRRRLGLALYHEAFVGYLHDRFRVSRLEAHHLFVSAIGQPNAETRETGMLDGYTDGLLALGGKTPPRKLFECLTRQIPANDQAPQTVDFAVAAAVNS